MFEHWNLSKFLFFDSWRNTNQYWKWNIDAAEKHWNVEKVGKAHTHTYSAKIYLNTGTVTCNILNCHDMIHILECLPRQNVKFSPKFIKLLLRRTWTRKNNKAGLQEITNIIETSFMHCVFDDVYSLFNSTTPLHLAYYCQNKPNTPWRLHNRHWLRIENWQKKSWLLDYVIESSTLLNCIIDVSASNPVVLNFVALFILNFVPSMFIILQN